MATNYLRFFPDEYTLDPVPSYAKLGNLKWAKHGANSLSLKAGPKFGFAIADPLVLVHIADGGVIMEGLPSSSAGLYTGQLYLSEGNFLRVKT